MSINGIAISDGATYTPAGGTAITFDATGEQVAGGIVCVNQAETDFFAREKLYTTSRVPSLGSDGEYTKLKSSARIVRPLVIASGKVVYNVVRVELEVHPESAAGEVASLRSLGAGICVLSGFDDFFTVGSLK